ncbi:MAG: hypothetical protein Q9226_005529, partial [Calogaya cf. arnoldii]
MALIEIQRLIVPGQMQTYDLLILQSNLRYQVLHTKKDIENGREPESKLTSSKLQVELGSFMASNPAPKWSQLEQLPYFGAVITEGLRLGYGVVSRVQRIFPDTVFHPSGYDIPTTAPAGMTTLLVHDDPAIFPDPRTFKPDRFLEQPELRKHIITFSKGSRQCAGLKMAYAELYLVMAAIWAPAGFKWELFGTDLSVVETIHNFLNTSPSLDSKGTRVKVNKQRAGSVK